MSSFSIYTRITIEIYARFRWFTTDFTAEYTELPPFLHKGVVVKKGAAPIPWTVPENVGLEGLRSVAAINTATPDSTIYTAHQITVSNNTADEGSSPCLETAPIITEAMPTLVAGVTDTQSISFTLLDPQLRQYFSSDFTTTNSIVRIYRVGKGKTSSVVSAVWVGYITSITQGRVDTTISARNEMKKLEQKATFGFLDEIPKWRVNDYKVPIISAVMIPYTVQVEQHTPQLVSYYEDWRRDYYLLATGRNLAEASSDGINRLQEEDITFEPFFGDSNYMMSPDRASGSDIISNLQAVGKIDSVTAFTYAQDIFFIATRYGFIYAFNLLGEPHDVALHNLGHNPYWATHRFVGFYNGWRRRSGHGPYIRGMTTDGNDLFFLLSGNEKGPLHKLPITFFTESKSSSKDVSALTVSNYREKLKEVGTLNYGRFKPEEAARNVSDYTVTVQGQSGRTDAYQSFAVHYPGRDRMVFFELASSGGYLVGFEWEEDGDDDDRLFVNPQGGNVSASNAFFDKTNLNFELPSAGSATRAFYESRYFSTLGSTIFSHEYYNTFHWAGIISISNSFGASNYLLSMPYWHPPKSGGTRIGSSSMESHRLFDNTYTLSEYNNSRIDLEVVNICTVRINPKRSDYRGLSTIRDDQRLYIGHSAEPQYLRNNPNINMEVIDRFKVADRSGLRRDGSAVYLFKGSTTSSARALYLDKEDYAQARIDRYNTRYAVDNPVCFEGDFVWSIREDRFERGRFYLVCHRYYSYSRLFANNSSSRKRGISTGFTDYPMFRIELPRSGTMNFRGLINVPNTNFNRYTDIDIRDDYIYVIGQFRDDQRSGGSLFPTTETFQSFVIRYRLPYSIYMEDGDDERAAFSDITAIGNNTLIGLSDNGYFCFYDLLEFKSKATLTKTRIDTRIDDFYDLGEFVSIAYRKGHIYVLEKGLGSDSYWNIVVYTTNGKRRKHLDFALFSDPEDPFFKGYQNNDYKDVAGIDIVGDKLYVARSDGNNNIPTGPQKYQPYVGVWELPELDEESEVDLLSLVSGNVFEGMYYDPRAGDYYLLNSSTNTVMVVDFEGLKQNLNFVFDVEPGETAFGLTGDTANDRMYMVVNRYIEATNTFTGYLRVYNLESGLRGYRIRNREFKLNDAAQYTGLSRIGDTFYILNALTSTVEVWGVNGSRRINEDIQLEVLDTGQTYEGVQAYPQSGDDICVVLVADPSGTREKIAYYPLDSRRSSRTPSYTYTVTGQLETGSSADLAAEQRVYNGIALYPVSVSGERFTVIALLALGVDQINIDAWFTGTTLGTISRGGASLIGGGSLFDYTYRLADTRDFSGITAGVGLLSGDKKQVSTRVNFFLLDRYDNTVRFYLAQTGTASTIIRLGSGDWTGITTDDAVNVLRQRISKDGYIYVLKNSEASFSRDGLVLETFQKSVHVYSLDGRFIPSRSFGIEDGDWSGITVESLGTNLYILDNRANRVVSYDTNGNRSPLRDFKLPSAAWRGITTDGLYLYVLDNGREYIRVYSLTGKRRAIYDRQLPNKDWRGITTDNEFLYIVNNTDKSVEQQVVAESFSLFRGTDGKTSPDQARETGQGILTNYVNNTLNPNYITFNKEELPRSFIQMERNGRLTFNRGIFILPSEDDNPTVPGETFSPLALRSENFRLALAPAEALSSDISSIDHWGFRLVILDGFDYDVRLAGTYIAFHATRFLSGAGPLWFGLLDSKDTVIKGYVTAGNPPDRIALTGTGNVDIAATNSLFYVLDNTLNKITAYNHIGTRRASEDITLETGNWTRFTEHNGEFFIHNVAQSRIELWTSSGHDLSRAIFLKDLPGIEGIDKNDIESLEFYGLEFNNLYCVYDISSAIDALDEGIKANSGRYVVAIYDTNRIGDNPTVLSFGNTRLVGIQLQYDVTVETHYAIGMTTNGEIKTYEMVVSGGDFSRAFYQPPQTFITKSGNLYDGIGEEPFTANIGTSFTRWSVLGVSRSTPNPIDTFEREFVFNYSDGNDDGHATRSPHPLDPLYISQTTGGKLAFLWFNYHNMNKFYRVRRNPRDYFLDFWATYLIHGRPARNTFPTVGIRSKDMYSTESTFKDFQLINPNRSHALYDYTLDGSVAPNPLYEGSASILLRLMPALRDRHRTGTDEQFCDIVYKNSPHKGGAYYVSARYQQPDVMYYDTSIIENESAYEGYLRSEYYNGFYHHDMYGAHAEHLRPSTFIYACVKNAGLTPAFAQNGSDVAGDLNDHRMQLISNTDTQYRDLITRVLPSLGYLLRMNGETREIELVDLFTSTTPVFTFTDEMIEFIDVNYDSSTQYSSFTFENEDMLRGDNTLDEFRENEEETGRQVVFNSNVFLTGKPLSLKTGTWTSAYEKVSTYLSRRQDKFQITVSNCVLMEETGRLNIPAVGDWVRVVSDLVPGIVKEVDVLLISKNVSEATTQYTGIRFERDT